LTVPSTHPAALFPPRRSTRAPALTPAIAGGAESTVFDLVEDR